MDIKFPDLKGVQRAEIWGIVIVICFNLTLLAVAIRFGALDPLWVIALSGIAQVCSAGVIILLLRVRVGLDIIDNLCELPNRKELTMEELLKQQKSIEKLLKVLNDLPCIKNLPPS